MSIPSVVQLKTAFDALDILLHGYKSGVLACLGLQKRAHVGFERNNFALNVHKPLIHRRQFALNSLHMFKQEFIRYIFSHGSRAFQGVTSLYSAAVNGLPALQKIHPPSYIVFQRMGLAALCSLCVSSHSSFASADTLTGRASVIDGDTLEMHGERIRLKGIDAPESGQFCEDESGKRWRCGQKSALFLDALINEQMIRCEVGGVDRYARKIATCFVSDLNVNSAMVYSGHALAYRRYSTQYLPQEDLARQLRVGIWKGRFIPPWAWRKGERL